VRALADAVELVVDDGVVARHVVGVHDEVAVVVGIGGRRIVAPAAVSFCRSVSAGIRR
jgi:hypothetical protein